MKLSKGVWALIVISLIIILDQALKIWVKTHFYLGQEVDVLPFFKLRFIENPGMAFGMQLGSKLFLTVFRVVVIIVMAWYLWRLRKTALVPMGYIACIGMIIAGAAGNIFDCLFYGEIFNNPAPPETASFVSWGDGYGAFGQGRVVDMLYFPLFSFTWPGWVPFVGGDHFSFFDPVFNLADASITVGIIALLLFYHRYVMVLSDADVEKIEAERQKKAEKKKRKDTDTENEP